MMARVTRRSVLSLPSSSSRLSPAPEVTPHSRKRKRDQASTGDADESGEDKGEEKDYDDADSDADDYDEQKCRELLALLATDFTAAVRKSGIDIQQHWFALIRDFMKHSTHDLRGLRKRRDLSPPKKKTQKKRFQARDRDQTHLPVADEAQQYQEDDSIEEEADDDGQAVQESARRSWLFSVWA